MNQTTAKQIIVDELAQLESRIQSNETLSPDNKIQAIELLGNIKKKLEADDWYEKLTRDQEYFQYLTQLGISVSKKPKQESKLVEKIKVFLPFVSLIKPMIDIIRSFWDKQ